MQKIKSILFIASLVVSLQTWAQQPGNRQPMTVAERVTRTVERIKPELSLTDQQVKDVEPIYTDYYTKMDALRSGGERPSPEARQKLNEERNEKLKNVLDETQMKKLKELEEQMRQRRPGGGNQ